MALHLNYLTDIKGKKTAVQIPFSDWKKFYDEYQKLLQFKKVKTELIDATKEIKMYESGKKKSKTLTQFLNEI